jgi:hypothetical protein
MLVFRNWNRDTKQNLNWHFNWSKKAIDAGVEFDFIGGDGLYGHNAELTRSLDKLDQFYVLDVHKDELIFLSEPTFSIPGRKSSRGREPKLVKPDIEAIHPRTTTPPHIPHRSLFPVHRPFALLLTIR